jgi:hypothetical protein
LSLEIEDGSLMTKGQTMLYDLGDLENSKSGIAKTFLDTGRGNSMSRILKWIGVVLGSLIGLILLAIATVYISSNARFNRTYEIQVESVEIPKDAASI